MGYTRRKVKTSRRVKRRKTKNTRKQKQRRLRNRAFRKSRRVNRGGSGKGKGKGKSRGMSESKMEDEEEIEWMAKENSEEDGMAKLINRFEDRETAKEKSERDAIDREKEIKTNKKIEKNIKRGLYRAPLGKGLGEVIEVDQRRALANTKNQRQFMDEMDAENEKNGLWFGGKKKRTIKKK